MSDPMDCSPPDSSVHSILQARVLEWAAMPSSKGCFNPGMEPRFATLQMDSLPSEPPGRPDKDSTEDNRETRLSSALEPSLLHPGSVEVHFPCVPHVGTRVLGLWIHCQLIKAVATRAGHSFSEANTGDWLWRGEENANREPVHGWAWLSS